MGILAQLITGRPIGATYAPWDNFWYGRDPQAGSGGTEAGIAVSPESALGLSAVYACVGLIADMIGTLPLHVYRRLPDDGKERAPSNPVYRLLHRQPNMRQTAKEWLTMGGAHMLLRGDFYNQIVLDGRGAETALLPLHPDRVTTRLLDSGRRGYIYRPPRGQPVTLTQDEVFHVMGLTLDGVHGCSVIEYARETIASSQAQEGFSARFWRQGAEGHLAFVAPNALSPQAREANEKVLQDRLGGWRQAHKPILLEGGMKAERISVSGRDAQYIESKRFSVADIARFFRVPPHMIGDVDGTTSWGTGIEQLTIGFVNFTLMPWLVAIQQAADRDLILADDCFAEFNVDALLRGEAAARADAHRAYVDGGIKSVNEIRVIENLNRIPGEEYDRPHRAANIGSAPAGGNPDRTRRLPPARRLPAPPADEPPADEPPPGDARAGQIALEAAARLVRKETAAIRRWAPRFEGNRAGWVTWVTDFYGTYVADLERDLLLPTATARAYCAGHCESLLAGAAPALADEWDRYQAAELAAIALEEATP